MSPAGLAAQEEEEEEEEEGLGTVQRAVNFEMVFFGSLRYTPADRNTGRHADKHADRHTHGYDNTYIYVHLARTRARARTHTLALSTQPSGSFDILACGLALWRVSSVVLTL